MVKFRYSLNGGTSWTTIDAALPFTIPSTASQDVLVEPIGTAVLNEKPGAVVTAPAAFALNQWSVADNAAGGSVKVTISALPNNGGSAITAIQYKVDTGAWTNSGISSTGNFNITGLTNGTAVNVLVRAVNAVGNGADSDTKSVTPTTVPFTSDANTYFWDFVANDNGVDQLGSPTLAFARERVGDKATLINANKAYQPVLATGGITFNQATSANIMSISGATGTTASRMWVDFTGSRNIRLRYGAADSTTLTTIFTSAAQLTLGQKYAIEILFDFDADSCTLWINGVNQNVTVSGAPWSNFPASNPREVLVGNNTTGTTSLDAVLNNIVFQDGVPSAGIRTSVSAFQQTRQAA